MVENGYELPKNIYNCLDSAYEESTEDFCESSEPGLTESEIMEYLIYKKLELLKTIKNCVVFFTVLIAISLVCSLLLVL